MKRKALKNPYDLRVKAKYGKIVEGALFINTCL